MEINEIDFFEKSMSQAVAQHGATEGYGGVGVKAPKRGGSE